MVETPWHVTCARSPWVPSGAGRELQDETAGQTMDIDFSGGQALIIGAIALLLTLAVVGWLVVTRLMLRRRGRDDSLEESGR